MDNGPLKILITDPHLKGGGQVRYLTSLARELVRQGHHVTIGCKPESVLAGHARDVGANCRNVYRFKGGLRPRTWAHDIRRAKDFIQSENPDVLHVNGSQDHWVHATANRLLGRPICVLRTRHNTYPVRDSRPNRILNLHWTDYQIVVCDVVRRDLAKQPTFDAARMCSIHNGVDAQQYRPDPELRIAAREEFGYTKDHLVCGIAARLVKAKGQEFLIEAAARLYPDFPNLRLLILGQGDTEAQLKKRVNDLELGRIVHFAGFRDDMARCVQAFDIGVQPSIDCDTSSFSLKEQMAAEKPVVASDYGGLTEIVSDGVEGLVVPAGTVEPLADALRTLFNDPQRRGVMGAAGRQRVLREFTVQIFAERTAETYRHAMEIHRQRRLTPGEEPISNAPHEHTSSR